jgi:hypothetical protein
VRDAIRLAAGHVEIRSRRSSRAAPGARVDNRDPIGRRIHDPNARLLTR